ncbi:DUF4942 domain-containing protein [Vibrio harveyi]|uniref:DUF4942 domain-containing protein n=1 Tax=Vibrio harveyi TaxID=669 RepID=UPI003BB49247|nr:DUF4942 domain-containing protein [Vibrio harveyi]
MSTELIEVKLVESLVQKRTLLIDHYCNAINLQKLSFQLSEEIDSMLPSDNASYYQTFTTIFYDICANLGEKSKSRYFHKVDSIITMTDEKIKALITSAVDENLWSLLFNRMGFKSMMSEAQRAQFNTEEALAFTIENVRGTLAYWLVEANNIMLSGVMDTISKLGSQYISNSRIKAGQRIIIKNALGNVDNFSLDGDSELRQLLNYVWRLCFGGGFHPTKTGFMNNEIWQDLNHQLEQKAKVADGDISFISYIESHGIEFRFFQNKNVHVLLPDPIISMLNNKLSESNYLSRC